jgi:CRP-like cAMP-binding protein
VEEGFPNDKLFVLREGVCGVYVNFKRPNLMGKQLVTKTKVATITSGEIFGESALFRGSEHQGFDGMSELTIEVESVTCRSFFAKARDFARQFPKVMDRILDMYRAK